MNTADPTESDVEMLEKSHQDEANVKLALKDLTSRNKVNVLKKDYTMQAWLVCLVAPLFCFYEFIQLMMFNAIDPYLMRDFHVNATGLGGISAAYLFANLLFMFPAGIILDRFSTRKLIISAMTICICGTFLFSLSTSVHMAMLGRFLTGIGGAFPLLSCLRLASRWFPAKRLALVTGVMVTIMMLGGVCGQTPMTFLVELMGWRNALRIDALLGVVFIGLMYTVIQDFPPHGVLVQDGKKAVSSWADVSKTIISVLKNRPTWLFGIYTCLLNLPIMLLGAVWGSLFLTQTHHFTALQSSYVTSMIFFGTIVGSPIVGFVSDALKKRKLPMIVFGVLSLGVVLTIMYLPHASLTEMIILFFLLGLMTSAQVITYPAIAESNPSQQAGAALGLASVLIVGSIAFFQPLFGWLMDFKWKGQIIDGVAQYSVNDYHAGFLIFPIAFVVGVVAVCCAKETYKK